MTGPFADSVSFPQTPHNPRTTAMPSATPGGAYSPDTNESPLGRTDTASTTASESWADLTHSVIWMSRNGKAVPLMPRRIGAAPAISLLVVVLVTLLAAANLIDVYGDPVMWTVAAGGATLAGALVALAGVMPALRLWWQIVFLAFAQCVLGPVVTLNGTTIGHVIPTPATLAQGWQDMFGAFKYLIAIEPPVGTADGSLMAVWTLCLWFSFLEGALAIMPSGRLSVTAAAPLAILFAVTALLGTTEGVWPGLRGLAAALALVVWAAWRWNVMEFARWISALIILMFAAAVAVGGCMAVSADRTVLRDRYDPPIDLTDATSPLSGMRAYLKDHREDTLLTVTGLPAGTPVRLAVMDRFDGNVWNLSDSSDATGSSDYRRVGSVIASNGDGEAFTATFTVHEGLSDQWLPLAGQASRVRFTADGDAERFYYNTDTDSGMLSGGLVDGTTYTESGTIPGTPTDQQIDEADIMAVAQPQAQDVPEAASDLATAVAGGRVSGGAAARALADELKDTGWFSHGLGGDYPSSPGHGNYRVNLLLGGKAMVGDSEQYASAMALMARELGLPSRVVLGFLPKDENGEISEARTEQRSDGTTVTEFTGNDIEAWVEIALEDYGWVAFYPTPEETKVPDDNQNLTPPNPQTLVRQPPVPLEDPLRDETQANSQSSLAGEEADEAGGAGLWPRIAHVLTLVALYGSPVWAVLAVCGLILLAKLLVLVHLRRHGDARRRVTQGWRAVTMLAAQSGVQASGNRRDQARAIAAQLNLDQPHADALNRLGRQADYAAFSGQSLDGAQAGVYWCAVDAVRAAMLRSLPRLRRWRTRLSLRGMSGGRMLAAIRRHVGTRGRR